MPAGTMEQDGVHREPLFGARLAMVSPCAHRDRIGFRHVFTVLCRAVILRSGAVIDLRWGVHPDHARGRYPGLADGQNLLVPMIVAQWPPGWAPDQSSRSERRALAWPKAGERLESLPASRLAQQSASVPALERSDWWLPVRRPMRQTMSGRPCGRCRRPPSWRPSCSFRRGIAR